MGKDGSGNILTSTDVKFTWELLKTMLSVGLQDMGRKHWEEAVQDKEAFPYDPDWDGYKTLEDRKEFRIIAVSVGGHLIGYAGVRIFNSLQSKNVVCSYIQEYYIEPAFRRRGRIALRLFRFIHDQLKLMKVNYIGVEAPSLAHVKEGGLGRFFRILGYTHRGELWSRRV